MAGRLAGLFIFVLLVAVVPNPSGAQNAAEVVRSLPLCGSPIGAGPLIEPPQINVRSLPSDDLGRRELIMRVVHEGDRFCAHYVWNGAQQIVPPTLVVHRGERFALRLVNEISGSAPGATMKASQIPPCLPAPMSDVKVTPFNGYLNHTLYARAMPVKPLDVNLHMHGFEGPPEQENIFLSTLSTAAHACEYDITIPRTQPPGTYFYHSHAHGASEEEVAGGLTGMWIVQPDAPRIQPADEHEIILRSRVPFEYYEPALAKQERAKVVALVPMAAAHETALRLVPALTTYDPFDPPPWPSVIPLRAGNQSLDVHGCGFFPEGVFTVNGMDAPAELTVPAGKPQLLRVLNAMAISTKYIRLSDASGNVQMLHVVGRDGIPVSGDDAQPLAQYVPMSGVVLGAGMRADILLTLDPDQTVTLYSDRLCFGPFGSAMTKHDLVTITGSRQLQSDTNTRVLSTPVADGASGAMQLLRYAHSHASLVRRRALTFTEYDLPNPNGKGLGHAEFYITETSKRGFHERPYWPTFVPGQNTPAGADIVVKQGSVEEWYMFNATLTEHTFHIHQMAFAAEDEPPMPVMLDTVVVPPGKILPNAGDPNYPFVKPSRTRIVLDFRHVPRGEFVYHCHMINHEDGGMMGVIRVE